MRPVRGVAPSMLCWLSSLLFPHSLSLPSQCMEPPAFEGLWEALGDGTALYLAVTQCIGGYGYTSQ